MGRRTREARRASPPPTSCGTVGTGRHEYTDAVRAKTVPPGGPAGEPHGSERRDVLSAEEVEPRAYAIWLARGRPEGTEQENWFEAEWQPREERVGKRVSTHATIDEQAREAVAPSRERTVDIRRENQQAGRQGQ